MLFEGDLRRMALPQVIERVAYRNHTGILTIQGQEDIVAVSFLEGKIVAADALNQTVEDGLGQVLVDAGLVDATAFETAAAEHQGGSTGSLADLLMDKGLLNREQLLEGLRQQTYRMMLKLLSWRRGEFKFYGGDEVAYEEGMRPISVGELLIRSLEDLDDGRHRSAIPELQRPYDRQPVEEAIRVIGRDGEGDEDGVWVSQAESEFLALCDGNRSAAAIGKRLRLEPYEIQYVLFRLLRMNLLLRSATSDPLQQEAASALRSPTTVDEPVPEALFEEPIPPPQTLASPSSTLHRPTPGFEPWVPWVGRAVALVALVVFGALLLTQPTRLLLPFPWQESMREAAEHHLRESLYRKIDHAARAHAMVEGQLPETLERLVRSELLGASDRRDPSGRPLSYSHNQDEDHYTLAPLRDGAPLAGAEHLETIAGDFLLDQGLLPDETSDRSPLVLLD
ncbi:MAG: DUF4388 domain-containing protein [Acidobacteriota bacterium]